MEDSRAIYLVAFGIGAFAFYQFQQNKERALQERAESNEMTSHQQRLFDRAQAALQVCVDFKNEFVPKFATIEVEEKNLLMAPDTKELTAQKNRMEMFIDKLDGYVADFRNTLDHEDLQEYDQLKIAMGDRLIPVNAFKLRVAKILDNLIQAQPGIAARIDEERRMIPKPMESEGGEQEGVTYNLLQVTHNTLLQDNRRQAVMMQRPHQTVPPNRNRPLPQVTGQQQPLLHSSARGASTARIEGPGPTLAIQNPDFPALAPAGHKLVLQNLR